MADSVGRQCVEPRNDGMQPSVEAEGEQGGDGEHHGKERESRSVRVARPSRRNGARQFGKARQSL